MAGRSHLCSGPEEILFYIIEHLLSSDYLYLRRAWPDGQTIRFVNDQVLHLSQVNHLFRRLCLPLLYKHIIIWIKGSLDLSTANGSTHALQFDLLRRTMERKPHLADLIRVIEVTTCDSINPSYNVFDSLQFLPKIKQIELPSGVKLDLDLLSAINSHSSLHTVYWPTSTNAFSFPNPLSLQHGALSRVCIEYQTLCGNSNSFEFLWLYFAKLGLRVKILTINETTPPSFLGLTYPGLCVIYIYVPPFFSSDNPEPLGWFPSFSERHPQLSVFLANPWPCAGRLAWEALKNVPLIRPLYDASHSRGLISSFSFASISIGVGWTSQAVIKIDSPQVLPEIIHLLDSLLPISMIDFRFRKPEPHVVPINVNDFVSAFQHKTLSSLKLHAVRRVLDLDSLSTDEELHLDDMAVNDFVHSNSRIQDRTKQLAQLTRLLGAGLPQLEEVDFHDGGDDDFGFICGFSVSDDGQVWLLGVDHGH